MPIWKLAPITTAASANAWAFTSWFGATLIRAKSPNRARQIAAEAFRKLPTGETAEEAISSTSPWLNDELVVCRRVPVSTYRPEGPDQILQPHVSEYGQRLSQ